MHKTAAINVTSRVKQVFRPLYFLTMHIARLPIYRVRNCHIAFSSWIGRGVVLVNSSVGPYSYLGGSVYLASTRVGSYCSIASGTKIGGMEHSWWWGSTSCRLSDHNVFSKETVVEDDVWVGANAVVRQGIHIGRGAVVGAGSVVLKDVLPYTIVAGVPAREIRKRFSEDVIRKITETKFWQYRPKQAKKLLMALDFRRDQQGPLNAFRISETTECR